MHYYEGVGDVTLLYAELQIISEIQIYTLHTVRFKIFKECHCLLTIMYKNPIINSMIHGSLMKFICSWRCSRSTIVLHTSSLTSYMGYYETQHHEPVNKKTRRNRSPFCALNFRLYKRDTFISDSNATNNFYIALYSIHSS
jgi:hypothetical protein